MSKRSIDGVDVQIATEQQLADYVVAQEAVSKFEVPRIYNSLDPKARVFVALFDGTGNDIINDPQLASHECAGKTNIVRMMRDPGPTVTATVTVVKCHRRV